MQSPTDVAVNCVIPLVSLIRRYGCDISFNGNAVNIVGKGYYDIDVSITVPPTAAGTVTATLIKDGVVVPGATASALASSTLLIVQTINCIKQRFPCCAQSLGIYAGGFFYAWIIRFAL